MPAGDREPAEVWPVVCAAGHRPQHLAPNAREWACHKLHAAARWLRDEHGTQAGISGMALGADLWWARAVLAAGLELWAYVPFPAQADRWPADQRAEWQWLLDQATRVRMCSETDPAGRTEAARMLHARNDAMLAASTAVVAVWDPAKTGGGTALAVRKAGRLPGVHLDPAARTVRTVRPGGFPLLARPTEER